MKVLFIGDVVGSAGREAVRRMLPALKQKHQPDFVLVNAENAAGGKGLTEALARDFYSWGADGLTMGNHTWDNKDIFQFIDSESRLVRPANFPPGTPGQGMMVLKKRGKSLAVINVQGRTFLPPLDCPFRTMDALLEQLGTETRCVFVDFHAEATSEKIAMGWYLDGRASVVVGTHTHVQTHDERVLPGGTAYVTDVGMCGSHEGVLGMEREAVMHRFLTGLPARFTADEGPWQFHAVLTEIDDATGRAGSIQLIRKREDEFIYE
ncbi:TIGR00282 family metallophosphoesterase [Xylanibacillus composti]|nr:TIGR00282 family metallophosphoesterase [Xylanibacillus composti]